MNDIKTTFGGGGGGNGGGRGKILLLILAIGYFLAHGYFLKKTKDLFKIYKETAMLERQVYKMYIEDNDKLKKIKE